MSGRFIVIAALISVALLAAGATIQSTVVVVTGLLGTLAAAMALAIKTDDTTQPMALVLFEDTGA